MLRLSDVLNEAPKGSEKWSDKRKLAYLNKHPNVDSLKVGASRDVKKDVDQPKPDAGSSEIKKSSAVGRKKEADVVFTKQARDKFKSAVSKEPKNVKPLGGGVNATYVFDLQDGSKSVFKAARKPQDYVKMNRSAAVKRVVDKLGWHGVVPETEEGKSQVDLMHGSKKLEKPDGLYMEMAAGEVLGKSKGDLSENVDIGMDKLDGDAVVRSVLLDTLMMQSDRHGNNLMVDKSGGMTLIDNDNAIDDKRGVISCMIPQTRFGELWKGSKKDRIHYTNFVDGGKIGTNYPKEFKSLLDTIAKSDNDSIRNELGLKSDDDIRIVRSQAKRMLKNGFEGSFGGIDPKEWE